MLMSNHSTILWIAIKSSTFLRAKFIFPGISLFLSCLICRRKFWTTLRGHISNSPLAQKPTIDFHVLVYKPESFLRFLQEDDTNKVCNVWNVKYLAQTSALFARLRSRKSAANFLNACLFSADPVPYYYYQTVALHTDVLEQIPQNAKKQLA